MEHTIGTEPGSFELIRRRTLNHSYDVISYQPEFKQQVIDLQTELWSPSVALNQAYFAWKYETNPYSSRPLLYLALHKGKVAGMRGFFPVRWEAGSPTRTLCGLYADDMVITRDHRNRGLMRLIMGTALTELRGLGHEYVFNLSAGAQTFISSLSMGWHNAGSMRPVRWRSWRLATRRGVNRVVSLISDRSAKAQAAEFEKSIPVLSDIEPSQVTNRLQDIAPSISYSVAPRIEEMVALVGRIGTDGRIRHVRDSTYFEWRFRNPLSRYGFLFCQREGLEGYLVLQECTSPSANRIGLNIVDWEGTSSAVLNLLIRAAREVAGSRPLFFWSATSSGERLALLAKNGFRPIDEAQGTDRHQPGLLVRALAKDLPVSKWEFGGRQLGSMAEWDLRMLYSMCG